MPDQSNQKGQSCNEGQESAQIGKDAGPADECKRTVSKPNVMNEEYRDGKQPATKQKQPRPALSGLLRKTGPRLQESKHEGQITKINHVDMGIDFGATVLEKAPDILEDDRNAAGIACQSSMGGSGKPVTYVGGILMKDEDGEYVSKQHPNQNQTDAAKQ